MTKREKILSYLKEHGIDLMEKPWIIETDRYQRAGTILIDANRLNRLNYEEWVKLMHIDDIPNGDGTYRYDPTCPIELKGVRDHFEWQYGLTRIVWKKEAK